MQYLAKFSARDRSSGLTVTITDPSGATIAATGTATVVGITTTTQTITQDAGAPFSGTIGTFTNSNDSIGSDSYSAYVNWGDGTWLAATVQPVSAGSNTFDIVSTNPSGAPGTYNPSVIINDNTNGMSDPDIIPPDPNAVAAPTGVAYSVSTNCQTVTLTWTNTATNSTSVEIEEWDETQVDYNGNPDTNFQWIQTLSYTTTTASITNLTPGGEYEFMVRAVGVGEASYSSPIDVTLPDAGTGVPAQPTLSVSSDFVFTTSDSYSGVSYLIEFKETDNTTTGNTSWNIWGANDWDDEGSFPNYINPMVGQSYEFRAIAVNGSLRSAPSAIVSMSDDSLPTPSAAVAGFTAGWDPTYGSSGQIDISYADLPSADYLQDVTFSLVQDGMTYPMDASDYTDTSTYPNVDGVVSFGLAAGAVGVTENGKDFDFWKSFTIEANVEQKDIDVYGHQLPAISPVATVAMPPQPGSTPPTTGPGSGPDTSAPAAPSNLSAIAAGANGIKLSWDNNSDNETGFNIYRGLTSDPTQATQIGSKPADQTTYTDSSAEQGVTYFYFIKAVNSAGSSDFSASASAQIVEYQTFELNRQSATLYGDPTQYSYNWNPLTHTFVYTAELFTNNVYYTNPTTGQQTYLGSISHWQVIHVYTWGDNGVDGWSEDQAGDVAAAKKAIQDGYFGEKIGPDNKNFIDCVDYAYSQLVDEFGQGHWNLVITANCKEEAKLLEDDAEIYYDEEYLR